MMSVSQSPAEVTVDQLPTDELAGLPRSLQQASDATIRLDTWARECDWLDLEDAIYRLGEMAGEILDLLEHAVECDEDECETCPTQADVGHYRHGVLGRWGSPSLDQLCTQVTNLLGRV